MTSGFLIAIVRIMGFGMLAAGTNMAGFSMWETLLVILGIATVLSTLKDADE